MKGVIVTPSTESWGKTLKSSWLISIKSYKYVFRMQFQMLEKFFDM